MSEKPDDNIEIRRYLLGMIELDAEREKIEARLMVDNVFFEELMFVEEDLTQDYVDDELPPAERTAFEIFFLITDERREKLRFARTLRKYIEGQKATTEPVKRVWLLGFLRPFLRSPLPVAALAAILVIGLTGWFFFFRNSSNQQAMAALNRAYEQGRPLESRITDFNYAPFRVERGESVTDVDQYELNSAFIELSGQVRDNSNNAKAQHALGRLYLAKKDFTNAIKQFQNAVKLAPDNAEIYSDLGTADLEEYKATLKGGRADPTRPLEALENFERAIRLNSSLLPAYFNRAICLQMQNLPNEAREAWEKYLELDPDSDWSAEALRNLNSLEVKSKTEVSADDKENKFFELFRVDDAAAAFQLASQNRELIRQKYLPQKIAMSFVAAPFQQRSEKLAALKYLGKLEKEKIDDNFASDLADFYAGLPPDKIEIAKKAQEAVREGYRLCRDEDNYEAALGQFKLARELFLRAGDLIEAHTITDYFKAYCIYSLNDRIESTRLLEEVGDFCERRGYKWFGLMNFYWSLGGRESLGRRSITESTNEYEDGLQRAKAMGDAYMIQKFFVSLIVKSKFFGRDHETFGYIGDLLKFSNQDNLSARQKFRNFDQIIQVLSESRFPNFAKAVALESATLASAIDAGPLFAAGAEVNAGIAYSQTGEYGEAEKRLTNARDRIKTLSEGTLRDGELARTLLNLGHLERKRNNLARAIEIYNECIRLSEKISAAIPDKSKTGSDLYEVRKSRLLAFQAMGDDESVGRDFEATIQIAEDYRAEILDEQKRFSFFDNQQAVYDIAVDYELRASRPEQAYEYAEISNSRSLSDWLTKGARVEIEHQRPTVLLLDSEKPLKLPEIMENIPPTVQILQFRMLEDRVVMWLISRETFMTFSSPVGSGELKEKIADYVNLVKNNLPADNARVAELSRELYKLLIQPVRLFLDPNKEICLIPNKALFYLPFPSLSSPEGKYLVEEFTTFYSPGANVFVRSTANASTKASASEEKLLGIGNPDFDGNILPKLEDLPDAAKEARKIGNTYPNSIVLTGRDATKNAFLAAYKNYDIIHLAGHYIAEPDSPLLSKLVLARSPEGLEGSVLTNFELLSGKLLKTKLVVLSACETGVEGYYGGEGLIGLSRTFLAVGVPLVVASSWKVDSRAASPLMQNFHKFRKQKGMSTVRALRAAQLDMLRDNEANYQAPYYWAAFAAFGGYANY